MTKKKRPNLAKPLNELELRKWCIEQAIRWPIISGYSAGQTSIYSQPLGPAEADILGRASRIMAWVKS